MLNALNIHARNLNESVFSTPVGVYALFRCKSPDTIRRWCRERKIPARKDEGGEWFINSEWFAKEKKRELSVASKRVTYASRATRAYA